MLAADDVPQVFWVLLLSPTTNLSFAHCDATVRKNSDGNFKNNNDEKDESRSENKEMGSTNVAGNSNWYILSW